jgi:UDP-2-acetamido-3-amino-2,3-dideoxy-glucuronate N-acetyltransferase
MPNFFVHPSSIIDDQCSIGKDTKIWHFSHVMSDAVIGEKCTIGQNVFIAQHVLIGNNVRIQNNVSLYEGVICEDDVFLGPSVVFTNVINPRSNISRKDQYQKTIIRRGATIGANATIICGIEIGKFAFIGAGTVITKSVPAYALFIGNPGKHAGWMSEHGCKLQFDTVNKAVCPESGQEYTLQDNIVNRIK